MTRHLILLIFFIFFLGLTARGQGSMSQAVRAFALDKDLVGAVVAIDVVDVSTGQRLAAHQPDLALIPASTQKLITTAVAMDVLGAQPYLSDPPTGKRNPRRGGTYRRHHH
jgi:D-alanyl-D-alanine carboxypeptidase/D-alanyl-D-alanine-endopeptidase (penicillin-binding protein 4)